MRECPELSELDDHGGAAMAEHVASCASCRVVIELLAERRRGLDARDLRTECARFEMLLAAREAGTIVGSAGVLLETHLRECADCQVVAATLPPPSERQKSSSLPPVSTAAYALGREVARGGMGRILEAEDMKIGRRVAVKELLGKAPALAARFEREARVTARLQHPGIVPIYEIGTWPDGTPFYTMRMVEGRTLRETINSHATLDERIALLPAVIAAAEAVAFAHGKRVIHRDLTPNNILVGEYGDTVVIDWGLAKDLSSPADDDPVVDPYRDPAEAGANLTTVGAVIGTATYMPPEQARGASVDERADVYALGAILYHLLAGTPPYRTGSSDDVIRQVQAGPPEAIVVAATGAPRDLVSIVEKAMSREPADRYPTARELVDELRRFQTGRLVEAHAYSLAERTRRWLRAHRALVIASTAAVLAITVAGSIGIAGVLRERNRAEVARAKAESENALLMEEQGRQELLAGNTTRALAWLTEAYKAGDASPELRFMLGTAMQRIESIVHTAECGGAIQSIEFSPDGSRAMAACKFGIGIARTSDWKTEVTIETHTDDAVYSHDGRSIASWDYKRLSLWNAATGARLLGPIELGDKIRTVGFTPDDRMLLTSSDDGLVRTWDASSGAPLRSLQAGSGAMNVVRSQLTPDGTTIVSMTSDGLYQVWDLATGAHLRSFKVGAQPIASKHGMISPDGMRVLSCTADGSVWINELATGRLISTFPAHARVAFECAYSRDGRQLLTTGMDGTAKVWETATGRLVSTLHHGSVWTQGRFSPDGERVATLGANGSLKIWHAASGTVLASFDDPFGGHDQIVYSPDGHTLISTRAPSTIVVLRDLDRDQRSIPLAEGASAQGASPDLSRLAIVAPDGSLTLIDGATLRPVPHAPIRQPFAFSHDSARMAAADADGTVVLDATSGKTLARFAGARPEMLALDDGGHRLLAAGARSVVWDVDRRELALDLGKRSDKDCLAPAGDVVLAWSDPRVLEVWNIDRRERQATIHLARETLGPVGFDASGGRVVVIEKEDPTASDAELGILGLYDVATGEKRANLGRSVIATLDGQRRALVTSAYDGRLVIRDASTGAVLSEVATAGLGTSGQALAGGAFIAARELGALSIMSAKDGRLLASVTPLINFTITQDQFLAGSSEVSIRTDGRSLIQLGAHPVQWTLPWEERPPEEIDRIVRERVRWRVVDGHLLPVTSTLRGRVVRRGQPIAAAEVALERGTGWLHAISGPDGHFEFPMLPTGHYGVIIFAPDLEAKGMHGVTIEQGDLTRDFELDEEATIAGVVVDEVGRPVSGVEIHAGLNEGSLHATSDAKGAFVIRALGAEAFQLHVVERKQGVPTGFTSAGAVSTVVRSKTDHITGIRVVVRAVPVAP
jgi:WD40 repeat protein